MRESNFSNPFQNKACVCISAAIYDRRALDCTATLPLINSLNHLAYLTSTSPRIREMVCLDGGLERLIRILRQVPRSPSQPPMRGVITKEMQAVWRWSLAFQCVVNIGVRGSETVRTRVVEAGMVPVAVRVLESYLRIADAIRDERKREARREEAKQRQARSIEAAELAALGGVTATLPSTTISRHTIREDGAMSHRLPAHSSGSQLLPAQHPSPWQPVPVASASGSAEQHPSEAATITAESDTTRPDETRPTTPAEGMLSGFLMSSSTAGSPSSSIPLAQEVQMDSTSSLDAVRDADSVAPVLAAENGAAVSPSSSSSSAGAGAARLGPSELNGSGSSQAIVSERSAFGSGTLLNVSSVEDFTASGSGSDGADEGEAEGGDESDLGNAPRMGGEVSAMEGVEDRTTPRPPRRSLAPTASDILRFEQTSARPAMHTQGVLSTSSASESNNATRPISGTDIAGPSVLATPTASTAAATRRRPDNTQTPRNVPIPTMEHRDNVGEQMPSTTAQHISHTSGHGERARSEREHESSGIQIHSSDMIYREEEVLLSLQLLAYLSKYAHVRTLFHRDLASLNALDPLEALEGRNATSTNNVSWSPLDAPKKNVFCIAERYTLRSSRTGLSHFASMGESRIAPEIQYWAGVIMRNACRKDEKQGGIRQCANMLCGKWEKQPREFAKCRRCRKAKYCSKQCQSKGWQMGHRFWCSARSDDEPGEANKERSKDHLSSTIAATEGAPITLTEDESQQAGTEDDQMHGGEEERHRHPASQPHHTRHHQEAAHRATSADSGASRLVANDRSRRQTELLATTSDASDPITSDVDIDSEASREARRNVAVGTDAEGIANTAVHSRPGSYLHQTSASNARRGPGHPYGALGQGVPSSGPSTSFGRRAVSAIPQHLQLPPSHSGDQSGGHGGGGGGSRSRTVSAASSSADVSDMSEDEMERASRRVLASTVAPVQRSPAGGHLTPLANVYTANEPGLADHHQPRRRSGTTNNADAASMGAAARVGGVPTRTDLAGRPLPPPVIARHDGPAELDMALAPDADLLNLNGRLTPAATDETETGVFGRGDFDQMIWRGRTPSLEDNQRTNHMQRRVPHIEIASQASASASQESLTTDEQQGGDPDVPLASLSPATHHASSADVRTSAPLTSNAATVFGTSPSMLNSALFLANQEDVGTPRFANNASLHAPIARPAHRFASVNAASSAMNSSLAHSSAMSISGAPLSSSPAPRGPTSPHSRGALMHTFGDWRTRAASPDAGAGSGQRSAFYPSMTPYPSHGGGLGSTVQGQTASSSSSSSLTSAPASASLSFDAVPQSAGDGRDDNDQFVIPSEIQNLFNAVEMQSTPRQQPIVTPSFGNDMEVDL